MFPKAWRRSTKGLARVLIALAALLLALPVLAQETGRAPQYHLHAGDEITIRVHGHPDLSGDFALDDGGHVSLPLVGSLRLQGVTVRTAARRIEAALRPDYLLQPRVGVRLLQTRPVYVLGEVETPGSYPYRTGLTVMEAVALAGGYSDQADTDALSVVRARDAARRRHEAEERTRVLPGDTIRVDSRFF